MAKRIRHCSRNLKIPISNPRLDVVFLFCFYLANVKIFTSISVKTSYNILEKYY